MNAPSSMILTPPHDLDAESSVLGSIFMRPETYHDVAVIIGPEDFFEPKHAAIFGAMVKLANVSEPIDHVLVARELRKSNDLDMVGGMGALFGFSSWVSDASNVTHHAEIVRDKSVLRRVAAIGTKIAADAMAPDGEASTVLESAEQAVFDIAMGRRTNELTPTPTIVGEVFKRLEELADKKNPISGIPSGLDALDEKTAGFQDSDLIIVAGRPASGKTSAVLTWVFHAASEYAKPALVFSLEMSKEQLVTRLMSSIGRVESERLRVGMFEPEHWMSLGRAASKISETPIHIDDRSRTLTEIRTRCRRQAASKQGLGIVMIDFLQLMTGEPGLQSREIEISTISRGLKAMAKELNIPVIALCQLNRGLEQRKDKRPVPSDARESGSIEQDADMMIFVYRDEVYNPDVVDEHASTEDKIVSPNKGVAEFIIGKQRNGATGTALAAFLGEYTTFENLDHDAAKRYWDYVEHQS